MFDLGDRYLVAKTDPITFATSEIGWYAVNVNANDVAVMGARPRWFLATVLLPAGKATAELAEEIFQQIFDACAALGVSLAGGHTEITVDLNRPIVSGTMLGEVAPERLLMTAGARVGDGVLLVKAAPIEGTALIALERTQILRQRGYGEDFIRRAQGFLHEPGISVVAPALLACRHRRGPCDARPYGGWRNDRAAGNGTRREGGAAHRSGSYPDTTGRCDAVPGVRIGSVGDHRVGCDLDGGCGERMRRGCVLSFQDKVIPPH